MAEIIRRVVPPHPCHIELDELDVSVLGCGTIAQCSCGKQFKLQETQFDGRFWVPVHATKEVEA